MTRTESKKRKKHEYEAILEGKRRIIIRFTDRMFRSNTYKQEVITSIVNRMINKLEKIRKVVRLEYHFSFKYVKAKLGGTDQGLKWSGSQDTINTGDDPRSLSLSATQEDGIDGKRVVKILQDFSLIISRLVYMRSRLSSAKVSELILLRFHDFGFNTNWILVSLRCVHVGTYLWRTWHELP